MAIAVTVVKRTGIVSAGQAVIADVTFDSTYPAGGEAYTAAMFGLPSVDFLMCEIARGSATTGYAVRTDHANSKLLLYNSNGAAPAALLETSTVDQSSTTVRVMAYYLPNV